MPLAAAAEAIALAAQRKAARRQTLSITSEDIVAHVQRLQRRPHQPRVSEVVWEYCRRQRPSA